METNSQEDTYRVYIDATIPSYLVSNPSRVAKTAERQRITREFWQDTRFEFIANPHTKPRIEQTCRNAGYAPPRIETPEAILEELSHV